MNMLNPPKFRIEGSGRIVLGSGVKFLTELGPSLIRVDDGAKVNIGARTVINHSVWIRARKQIDIETDVKIGPEVSIRDGKLHEKDPGDPCEPQHVIIRRNTLIGEKSVIKVGTTAIEIGEHSIVAEGAVVTKSVKPRKVVAGVPAREIDVVDCEDDYIRP